MNRYGWIVMLVLLVCVTMAKAGGIGIRLGVQFGGGSEVAISGDQVLWDASGDAILWDASNDVVLWSDTPLPLVLWNGVGDVLTWNAAGDMVAWN